jgi:hypothetical protein
MKLVTFTTGNELRLRAVVDDRVIDLAVASGGVPAGRHDRLPAGRSLGDGGRAAGGGGTTGRVCAGTGSVPGRGGPPLGQDVQMHWRGGADRGARSVGGERRAPRCGNRSALAPLKLWQLLHMVSFEARSAARRALDTTKLEGEPIRSLVQKGDRQRRNYRGQCVIRAVGIKEQARARSLMQKG